MRKYIVIQLYIYIFIYFFEYSMYMSMSMSLSMYMYMYMYMFMYMYIVELRICRNTVICSVFIHRKAKTTGNSEDFEVQVAINGIIYRILECFYALRGRTHCK